MVYTVYILECLLAYYIEVSRLLVETHCVKKRTKWHNLIDKYLQTMFIYCKKEKTITPPPKKKQQQQQQTNKQTWHSAAFRCGYWKQRLHVACNAFVFAT